MRFTAFVFSTFIFALALMPCGDGENHSHKAEAQTVIAQSHGDDAEHHTDLCSPFCLCQCCHTNAVDFGEAFVALSTAKIQPLQSRYQRSFKGEFYTKILQPPRA